MKKKFKKMILTPMLGAVSIIPPMVLACGPSVDDPDSKDSWEIDKEESIAFAEHKDFSEYDVVFDGTIGVFDKRSSFYNHWNANGKKNVPSETIKNTYKVRVWNGYEGGDLAKAIRIKIYNNFYKEKLWYKLSLISDLRKTFPKGFLLPNKTKVLLGNVLVNSSFDYNFTLVNTQIGYISSGAFAGSIFGRNFNLPKTLKYMNTDAFYGQGIDGKHNAYVKFPELFKLNDNFIGFVGNANYGNGGYNDIWNVFEKTGEIPTISKDKLTRFDLTNLQKGTDYLFYPKGALGKYYWWNQADGFIDAEKGSPFFKYRYSRDYINSNKGKLVSRETIELMAPDWFKER